MQNAELLEEHEEPWLFSTRDGNSSSFQRNPYARTTIEDVEKNTEKTYSQLQPVYLQPQIQSDRSSNILFTPKQSNSNREPLRLQNHHFQEVANVQNENRRSSALPQGTLLKSLQKCLNGGILNPLAAGNAIYEAYSYRFAFVEEEIDEFIQKNGRKVTQVISDRQHHFADPFLPLRVSYGADFVARISLSNSVKKIKTSATIDDLRGSIFWLHRKEFFYPTVKPFTGAKIDFQSFKENNVASHIRMKQLMIHVLISSCSPQTAIQQKWRLTDSSTLQFPEEMYHVLRDVVSYYFQLEEQELDAGVYMPEFSNMSCLRMYKDENAKKIEYDLRSAARSDLFLQAFDFQLRNALVDVAQGTFLPVQDGDITQKFTLRKRVEKRKKDE